MRSITASTKANTIKAAIPVTPIGVKKPAKAKNTIKAAMKTTIHPYNHTTAFETSGSLTIFNTTNPN
ncbi:MAG: hypothetical protein ACETWM_15190 [Candidatus Lokiarchaeia archaeon]